MKISKNLIFLFVLSISFFLSVSPSMAVTDYIFFSVNGDTTLSTMTQGDMLGWGSNCDVGSSVYWEIWYDVDNNSSLDPNTDVIFEIFTITDGIVIPNEIISDNDPTADGFIQTEIFPLVFESGIVFFKAVDKSDGTSAVKALTVNPMPSAPNQITGKIIVPDRPAPDPFLSNIWIVGESEAGFFIALTDENGNYELNFGSYATGAAINIEPGNVDGFVAPDDVGMIINGVLNGIDFVYLTPADSIYGYVKDDAGQIIPNVNWIECHHQIYSQNFKDAMTKNGRYAIYFTESELGDWTFGVVSDNLSPDYLTPYQVNFSHDTLGSFEHDIIAYRTDTVLYVKVTEDGGLPSHNYSIEIYSDLISCRSDFISGTGSNNISSVNISSLDNSGWSAWIKTEEDNYPIPTGYFVTNNPTNNISPGDTVTLNLSSNGKIVSDFLTIDPGDDPVDWTSAWVNLHNEFGVNYNGIINIDGSFSITCDTGTYFLSTYLDGYLPFPQYREVHVTSDTSGALGFEFNQTHARVTGSLVNVTTPITGSDIWIGASTEGEGNMIYAANAIIDNQSGTYSLFLCEGNWIIYPPYIPNYQEPAPVLQIIGNIPDTLRTVDFEYTYLGCCVGIRGNADGDPDELVDIGDIIYLVEYMFSPGEPGPAPVCFEEGDIAPLPVPDGLIDIEDLIMHVEYQFSPGEPGPAPGPCEVK